MVLSLVRRRPTDLVFASRYIQEPLPRHVLSRKSVSKDDAYQIIHDELLLDGSPRLNLVSFVTTWMEPECEKLMMEAINKNYVDMDEYPVTTELQVSLVAHFIVWTCLNVSKLDIEA